MRLIVLAAVVSLLATPLFAAPRLVARPPAEAKETPAVAGANHFALALYQHLRTDAGNVFYSPMSLSTALAMTSLGARGETAGQMYALLGFKLDDKDPMHAGYADLLKAFNADAKDRGYQLSVANALWGQRGFGFMPQFLADAKKHYGAGLEELDFATATEAARRTINDWVEKQTNEKIKDLIKQGMLAPDTRLVLTNAIYFKGNWASQFKKDRTKDEPFFLSAGKKIDVPMMNQTGNFKYAANGAMRAVELPYAKEELAMVLIAPEKVDGLAEFEKTLDAKALATIITSMRKRDDVRVAIPKFKMTCEFDLGSVLSAMGMGLAFSDKADFSGMATREQLFISKVVHKAFVDVNEEGTEAAGATAILMRPTAVMLEPPVFRADRPFVFVIRDLKSGAILFAGRVADPTKG